MLDPTITSFDTDNDGDIDRIEINYDADGDGITDKVVINIPADGGEHVITTSEGEAPVEVEVLFTSPNVQGSISQQTYDTDGDGVVDQISIHGNVFDSPAGTRTETVEYFSTDEFGNAVGNPLRVETNHWTDSGTPGDYSDDQLASTLIHDPETGKNTFVDYEYSPDGTLPKTETVRTYDGDDENGVLTETTVHTYTVVAGEPDRLASTLIHDPVTGQNTFVDYKYDKDTFTNEETVTVKTYDGEDENGALTEITVHTYNTAGHIIETKIGTYDDGGTLTQTVTHSYDDDGVLTGTEFAGVNGDPTVDITHPDINNDNNDDLRIEVRENNILQSSVELRDIERDYDGSTDAPEFDGEHDDVVAIRFYDAAGELVKRVDSFENDNDGLVDRVATRFYQNGEDSPYKIETVEINRLNRVDDNFNDTTLVDRVVTRTFSGANKSKVLIKRVVEDQFDTNGDGNIVRTLTRTFDADGVLTNKVVVHDADADGTPERTVTHSFLGIEEGNGAVLRERVVETNDADGHDKTTYTYRQEGEVEEISLLGGTDGLGILQKKVVEQFDENGIVTRRVTTDFDGDGTRLKRVADKLTDEGVLAEFDTREFNTDGVLISKTTVQIVPEKDADGFWDNSGGLPRKTLTEIYDPVTGEITQKIEVSNSPHFETGNLHEVTTTFLDKDDTATEQQVASYSDYQNGYAGKIVTVFNDPNNQYIKFKTRTDYDNNHDGVVDRSETTINDNVPSVIEVHYDNNNNGFVDRIEVDTFAGIGALGNTEITYRFDDNGDGEANRIRIEIYTYEGGDLVKVETLHPDTAEDAPAPVVTETEIHTHDTDTNGNRVETVMYYEGAETTSGTETWIERYTYNDQDQLTKLEINSNPAAGADFEKTETYTYDPTTDRLTQTLFEEDGETPRIVIRSDDVVPVGDEGEGNLVETVSYITGNDPGVTPDRTEVHTYDGKVTDTNIRVIQTTFDEDPATSVGVDRTERYTYDVQGRLERTEIDTDGVNGAEEIITRAYGADDDGNRVETVQYYEGAEATTDTLIREETWTYENGVRYLSTLTDYETVSEEDLAAKVLSQFSTYFYDINGDITGREDVTAFDRNNDGFTEEVVRKIYRDVNADGEGGNLIESVTEDLLDRDGDGTADDISRFTYNADGVLISSTQRIDEDGDGRAEIFERATYDENGVLDTTFTRYDGDDNGIPDQFVRAFYDDNGVKVREVSWSPSENGGPDQNVTEIIYDGEVLVSQFVIETNYEVGDEEGDAAVGLVKTGIRTLFDEESRPESFTRETYEYDPETRLVLKTTYDDTDDLDDLNGSAGTIDRTSLHEFDRPDVATGALVETVTHYDGTDTTAGTQTKIETLTYGTNTALESTEVVSRLVEVYEDGLIQRVEYIEYNEHAVGTVVQEETYSYSSEARGDRLRRVDEDADGNPDRGEYVADRHAVDGEGNPLLTVTRSETYEYEGGILVRTEFDDNPGDDDGVDRVAVHEPRDLITNTETITYSVADVDAITGIVGIGNRLSEEVREYNADGQITQSITTDYDPGTDTATGTVTRAYDAEGQVARIETANGAGQPITILHYDADGDDVQDLEEVYSYNMLEQLDRIDYYEDGKVPGTGIIADRSEDYTYYATGEEIGRIETTEFFENGALVEQSRHTYSFNVAGNLIRQNVNRADENDVFLGRETYTYDPVLDVSEGVVELIRRAQFDDNGDSSFDRVEAYFYKDGIRIETRFDDDIDTDNISANDYERAEFYNSNGLVDRTEYYKYDDAGRTVQTDIDRDGDGLIDEALFSQGLNANDKENDPLKVIYTYDQQGRSTERSFDTDGDGTTDQTLTFEYTVDVFGDTDVNISNGSGIVAVGDKPLGESIERLLFTHTDAFEFRLTETDAQSAEGLGEISLSNDGASTLILSDDVYSIIANGNAVHVLTINGDDNDTVLLTGDWVGTANIDANLNIISREYENNDGSTIFFGGNEVGVIITDDPFAL